MSAMLILSQGKPNSNNIIKLWGVSWLIMANANQHHNSRVMVSCFDVSNKIEK